MLHPFLIAVGERWHRGDITPAHEHLASAVVRDTLGWVLATLEPQGDPPTIVVATPAGELHEFGAMMAAVVAAQAGWRVRYLGPNLLRGVIAASIARTYSALDFGGVSIFTHLMTMPSRRWRWIHAFFIRG